MSAMIDHPIHVMRGHRAHIITGQMNWLLWHLDSRRCSIEWPRWSWVSSFVEYLGWLELQWYHPHEQSFMNMISCDFDLIRDTSCYHWPILAYAWVCVPLYSFWRLECPSSRIREFEHVVSGSYRKKFRRCYDVIKKTARSLKLCLSVSLSSTT